MATRRYDIENAIAPVVAAYLQARVDVEMQAVSPVIEFVDLMEDDTNNRIVVEVGDVVTQAASGGNFSGKCKVTVKSQWKKNTVAGDRVAHFERVNEVRDKLLSDALVDDLNAMDVVAGFAFDYINHEKRLATDKDEVWFYSYTEFTFTGLWKS